MEDKKMIDIKLQPRKRIALVAHDSRKKELMEWVEYNKDVLVECELYATGTTGTMLQECFLSVEPTGEINLPNEPGLPTEDVRFVYTNIIIFFRKTK